MSSRRELLLDAAIRVLGERGVRAVTHRAVDAEAGVGTGSTANYHPTREALYEAIVERFSQRERANFDAIAATVCPTSPAALGHALAAFARDGACRNRTLTLARYALLVESANNPGLREQMAAAGGRVSTWFANWLRLIGSSDPERDTHLVGNYITGLILHQLAIPDPQFDPAEKIISLLESLTGTRPTPAAGRHGRTATGRGCSSRAHVLTGGTMDRDDVWRAIDDQRRRLAGLLEDLSEQEWQHPSLCRGWTVRQVAAHIALQNTTWSMMPRAVLDMVRSGGMNGAIHAMACRHATNPTGQIIAEIRDRIGVWRPLPSVTYRDTAVDYLVHAQDIAIPLGRRLDMPADAAVVAANRVWTSDRMFHARKKLAGYRLVATDTTWSAGQGQEVTGSISALLLLLTGRPAALARLSGAGAAALAERIPAHAT